MTPITSISTIRTSKHFSGLTVEGLASSSSLSSNHAHSPLIHEITRLRYKYNLSDSSSKKFQLIGKPAIFSHGEFHSTVKKKRKKSELYCHSQISNMQRTKRNDKEKQISYFKFFKELLKKEMLKAMLRLLYLSPEKGLQFPRENIREYFIH